MARVRPEQRGERVYDLFQRGSALLEAGDFAAAAIPLERARIARARQDLDPRGARARLLPVGALCEQAGEEFAAVVERAPVNDFAHFCLGRALREDRPRARGAPAPGRSPRACARTAPTTALYRDRLRPSAA